MLLFNIFYLYKIYYFSVYCITLLLPIADRLEILCTYLYC